MLRVIVENAIQPDCFALLREPSLNSYTALQR